jgi:glycosyltransferase involved in cell wall biosynthesis
MTKNMDTGSKISVFVHLARGFGRSAWKQRWARGEIVGINHDDPYGYRQAEEMGCTVEQSEDCAEGYLSRWLRLGARAMLGFDLIHAWRNRERMFAADVVWTHTESQALAVLFLRRLRPFSKQRVKVIAQTVWLIDSWDSYSPIRRAFYRGLIEEADVLTFLSTSAVARARELFPAVEVEFVKYGIRMDSSVATIDREDHMPARILSIGNDRHRDWATLVAALRDNPRYAAKIATSAGNAKFFANVENITTERASTNDDLMALFRWADLVVVPLLDNSHASGITVIEEAVLCGIPVICTNVGGLRDYFSSDEVTYVSPQDSSAICSAIEELVKDGEGRRAKALRALSRMKEGEVNSRSFVARHVELSNRLLRRQGVALTSDRFSIAGEGH